MTRREVMRIVSRQDTLRPMRTRTLSRRCVSVAWAVSLILACGIAHAADLVYPISGSTRPHAFQWRLLSTASGFGHTDYFILKKTPVFGPPAWSTEGMSFYPEDICTTRTTQQGPFTTCKIPMLDRTARYCIQPCNFGFGCSSCYEEPQSELLRACRVGSFDTMVYINTPVPADCH